jgi:hypothetical protein
VVAVIVMGLLLVIGSIIVGTEVSRRLSSPKTAASPAAEPATLSTARSAASPFTQKIELPAGAQVISMTAVGDRLVVQVESQAGLTSAYVVDPRTGALLGTIDFPPGVPR